MRVKGWTGRSGLAKADIYTRGTVYTVYWITALLFVLMIVTRPVRENAPVVAGFGLVTGMVSALVGARLLRYAMDSYLGRGKVPRRLLAAGAALATMNTALGVGLAVAGSVDQLDEGVAYLIAGGLLPFLTAHSLLVPARTTVLVQAGALVTVVAVLAVDGYSLGELVPITIAAGFLTGWLAFTAIASVWLLKIMWEVRDARDAQARLAVAEERLRFGRDLHDVMGRNLAVIALKSELAVELARRGRPEAVDQMTEVQRIARDSQREVREVVRGYREADLGVELEGARSVLGAAGIVCTVVAGDIPERLPGGTRSALAWVVREAVTNILRHGDARRCTISVGLVDASVVLVVENDRADASSFRPGGGGSGLAGLRERLTAVGGTLEADRVRGARFRVTASVPLDGSGAGAAGPGGGTAEVAAEGGAAGVVHEGGTAGVVQEGVREDGAGHGASGSSGASGPSASAVSSGVPAAVRALRLRFRAGGAA
ncbi:sensor histidine kinase [Streptomyces sp. NPDC058953]|uniref:sensor histidine kinase n=1 Tax=unclassified Streptomyces TaxID=2593676 RepID=UPI0036BBC926